MFYEKGLASNFIKTSLFSCEFCKIFQSTFFIGYSAYVLLRGDYMITAGRDEILSPFAGIPVVS